MAEPMMISGLWPNVQPELSDPWADNPYIVGPVPSPNEHLPDPTTLTGRATQPVPGPGAGIVGSGYTGPGTSPVAPTLQGLDPRIPVQRESRGMPYVGYTSPETFRRTGQFTDLRDAPVDETGAPIWAGDMGPAGRSTAFGPAQITRSTWAPIARKLGITDWRAPGAYAAVANELYREAGSAPWRASAPGGGQAPVPGPAGTQLAYAGAPALALPANAPPPPLPEPTQVQPGLPNLGLALLGGLLRGVKFTPVSYDPWKIYKLGENPVGAPTYRLGSIGGGQAGG